MLEQLQLEPVTVRYLGDNSDKSDRLYLADWANVAPANADSNTSHDGLVLKEVSTCVHTCDQVLPIITTDLGGS